MLEVVCGPMFSGKSEELIRRVRRAQIAKQHVRCFKHAADDRYDPEAVASHGDMRFSARPAKTAEEIWAHVGLGVDVVGIDEVQFFDVEIVGLARTLSQKARVICAGLDLDYRGKPFGAMPALLALADKVTKLTAVCVLCGSDAARSFRKTPEIESALLTLEGEDLSGTIRVGAADVYEARCLGCWRDKP